MMQTKTDLTSVLAWTRKTLFRTVDSTVHRVEFEIGSEMRGGMGRLVRSA